MKAWQALKSFIVVIGEHLATPPKDCQTEIGKIPCPHCKERKMRLMTLDEACNVSPLYMTSDCVGPNDVLLICGNCGGPATYNPLIDVASRLGPKVDPPLSLSKEE